MDTTQPKLQNVIILRSFAIVAVVLYHCYCPWLYAWNWVETPARPIYSFIMEVMLVGRMPLFVFVSGYLFSHLYNDRGKYQRFMPFLNNKFKRLLVPLFLFAGLMCICLHQNYINAIVWNSGFHLWFLKMLFWSFVVCWFIARYVKYMYLEMCALAISVLIMFIPFPNIFELSQFSKYFAFFLSGYLFYKYRNHLLIITGSRLAGGGIMLIYIILCIVCLLRYKNNPQRAVEDIIHTDSIVAICRYVLRPVTVIMSFLLVDWVLSKRKTAIPKIFDSLNKMSYGIYLFHMLFIQLIYTYLLEYIKIALIQYYVLIPLLLFIIIFTVSAYLTHLLHKTKWGKWLIG